MNMVDVTEETIKEAAALRTAESWNFEVKVIGLWIDENWEVCEVE
ncbi:hypothetical protein [Candidatus Hakubella thermalkaliphila]|nr:hypothetical protein [Candidatus Hakubella thermalkaliphila]GFP25403.1 hypothetical protein HKBW3S25_00875 [Candidatus Hakubella thermalkaliphila]GFP27377.1 hypothetical protein HKBW3S33_00790 [Candidatus Hakubella thermalkaliphila]GFP31071.1 hypothetical protein HKBW3S34_01990 [Candidatus Hakubella thermalkaliphila]GFP39911.1 hypothetical protein HKBW3S47_01608 [Candidatus Hakubella thermalkaliphila]GFP41186.1 hypothetical protein HKBW3C_00312 [Candidatus Hakubella thermalkaliphila]